MKTILPILVALCLSVCACCKGADEPFPAVKAIVGRLAGGYDGAGEQGLDREKAAAAMAQFRFERLEDDTERATIGPDAKGRHILIRASSESAAAFALGRYIRDIQKGCISWCGNRIPNAWPIPETTIEVAPSVPIRFAYNYCTLSYTMAFWDAAQWREEIDRLALSGFNVALVLQGLPAVWRQTLSSAVDASGKPVFSQEDIRAFIADEAAQAWWHMGNLEGLGGPLSDERIDKDARLGAWIYAEMMLVGIRPCLQSYVGFVPNRASEVLVDDDPAFFIVDQGKWDCFERPDVLNPLSKAFDKLSKAWYRALKEVYRPDENGWTPYLCGDLFHEGGETGPLTEEDLTKAAMSIQEAQGRYWGPSSIWVLQHWGGNPRQAIRNGLNPERTLIQYLDSYLGKNAPMEADFVNENTGEKLPWIWAGIFNFGGKQGLHGGMRRLRTLPQMGTVGPSAGAFRGYGMLSEGLETNAALYEAFLDAFDAPAGKALDDSMLPLWWQRFAQCRYGMAPKALVSSLDILGKTVWNYTDQERTDCQELAFCAKPAIPVTSVSRWGWKEGIEYAPEALYPAAFGFLAAAKECPELLETETFRFDFCELFVQLLAERSRVLIPGIGTPGPAREEFRRVLDLTERLLACEPRFTLAFHEDRTRSTAGEAGVQGYRRMITSWTGEVPKSDLYDYAYRAYAGLVKDYYARRWEWFFALQDGKLRPEAYKEKLRELDRSFLMEKLEPTQPGNLVQIGAEVLALLPYSSRCSS